MRRDTCARSYHRKGQDPIPVLVSKHKDIEHALAAFNEHPDFGKPGVGPVVTTDANGKEWPKVSEWLLNVERPFNVRFESELNGDDGAVKTFKELDFNFEVLGGVVQKYGDKELIHKLGSSGSKWLKSFQCDGKTGFDLHECWANKCKECSVEEHFKRRGKAKSAFAKLYKLKVPKKTVVKWGYYKRYNDNGTTREKWTETLVPWKQFLDNFSKFCVAKQAYFHVYAHFMDVTKVTPLSTTVI